MERLFSQTKLRLKWDDTHITVHDTVSDLLLKVNLRILHDRVRQRYNVETDLAAFEAAEEEPGKSKYTNDRCKVLIESKAIIDRFVLDGCLIDSVDSLQVCGLEIHFGNATLLKPGLYVGTQFYTSTIDKSLSNVCKYFDLALYLLCFRDQCVTIANQYEEHLINDRSKRIATKRSNCDLPKDDLIKKQSSVTWKLESTPKNLFGSAE